MLFALLLILIRRARRTRRIRIACDLEYRNSRLPVRTMAVAGCLAGMLAANSTQAQNRGYKVMRSGSEIGWVSLFRQSDSLSTFISMASQIRIQVLFTISLIAKEESEFRGGQLAHSYFYRKRNSTVKADRHTRLQGSRYWVEDEDGRKPLDLPAVSYNTLCLYYEEPKNRVFVYSDNCQCNLPIEHRPDGAYRISLPGGGTNDFYYRSGDCSQVKIDYGYYSVTLVKR